MAEKGGKRMPRHWANLDTTGERCTGKKHLWRGIVDGLYSLGSSKMYNFFTCFGNLLF